jgi:hypothetical protein
MACAVAYDVSGVGPSACGVRGIGSVRGAIIVRETLPHVRVPDAKCIGARGAPSRVCLVGTVRVVRRHHVDVVAENVNYLQQYHHSGLVVA